MTVLTYKAPWVKKALNYCSVIHCWLQTTRLHKDSRKLRTSASNPAQRERVRRSELWSLFMNQRRRSTPTWQEGDFLASQHACEVSDATASNPEGSRLPMPSHMEEKDKVLALSTRWTRWHPNPGKSHPSVFFPPVYRIPVVYNGLLQPRDATQYILSHKKPHAFTYTHTNLFLHFCQTIWIPVNPLLLLFF